MPSMASHTRFADSSSTRPLLPTIQACINLDCRSLTSNTVAHSVSPARRK